MITIPIKIYRAQIQIVHCNWKKLRQTVRKEALPKVLHDDFRALTSDPNSCAGATLFQGKRFKTNDRVKRFAFIFINSDQDSTEKATTCVHEAAHACLFILETIGHDLPNHNHEPFTYMLDHVTELAWKACGIRMNK